MNTPHILKNLSISIKLINGLILTHCHADHDSGMLEMLLHGTSQCTRRAGHNSFLRKYAPITELNAQFLKSLFVGRRYFPTFPGRNGGYALSLRAAYNSHDWPVLYGAVIRI